MHKSEPLLLEHNVGLDLEDAGSDSYSSSSSFTNSYSDGSDLTNWEEFVMEDGSLFYAEYLPQTKRPLSNPTKTERRIEFTRNSSLRSEKKPSRRHQQQKNQTAQQHSASGKNHNYHPKQQQEKTQCKDNGYKFSHIKSSHENNCKRLELIITAADRFRFGRRSTAVESILGFRVLPFVDKPECLMVDGFVHDIPVMQNGDGQGTPQADIKRGDWLKSLDNIDIRTSNVDDLLLQFVEPTKVCLTFQGTAKDDNGESIAEADMPGSDPERPKQIRKIENLSMFAESFELAMMRTLPMSSSFPNPPSLPAVSAQSTHSIIPFALLILAPECYQHDAYKDSLYYYPECPLTNFLYKARGSFLTLNAVLSEELHTKPLSSKLMVDQITYFVNYRALNGFLVIFSYAAGHFTLSECRLQSDELINYMCFAFPNLNLENFANDNESSISLRKFLRHFCEIQRVRCLAHAKNKECQFEELLKESRSMPLPKEAQLRILNALSEMEAMDYRNWNDEPLTTHREFFIYGSVLYYDYYMLASQLPVEVQAYVEGFLRCRGIFDFIARYNVKELYVWEEIYLANSTGRYFLTICTRSHLILAVILKLFDAPDLTPNQAIPPSLFYIEEIQETVDHLIQCGIESLAMFWSISNKRPEIIDKTKLTHDGHTEKESRTLESFIKQKLTVSNSGGTSTSSGLITTSGHRSFDEDTHLGSSLGGSSTHSLTLSEDDSGRKRLSMLNVGEDSDSGSDWENFTDQHPVHNKLNTEGQNQMTESLWKEIKNVVPVKISAGWKNSVFYYIYVDTSNGSLFCPLNVNLDSFPFLHEMRKACHVIHEVLQSTKNLRRNSTESNKSSSSTRKVVLAVKEHGITIEVRDTISQPNVCKEELKGRFVVVGRLFHSPAKEVYVCYRPEVPQNMVEMAFRLSFFSVG